MSNDLNNFCLLGKQPAFIIECESCGKKSIVSDEHGRYCPICGPDVITPITVTKYEEKSDLSRDYLKNAKTLADNQYYPALELGNADSCIGFPFKGQWIIHPWMDQSGRFELTTEQAIATYGKENFDNFCRSITQDANAKKVQGYDNSPVRHTGII